MGSGAASVRGGTEACPAGPGVDGAPLLPPPPPLPSLPAGCFRGETLLLLVLGNGAGGQAGAGGRGAREWYRLRRQQDNLKPAKGGHVL